jgi:hypothetical protein
MVLMRLLSTELNPPSSGAVIRNAGAIDQWTLSA